MLRALGCCGLGILFVAISPELRTSVFNGIDTIGHAIEIYSPLSYVGIGIAILAGLMLVLHRAAQPKI